MTTATLVFYRTQVVDTAWVTPQMRRVTLGGADLARFESVAPDQYVKMFFPPHGGCLTSVPEFTGDVSSWYQAYQAIPEDRRPVMRTYTIRRHDQERGTVDIDFALHGAAGPASRWAATAEPGAELGLLGPAALDKPADGDWRLIVGDAAALPAIGSIVEQLPAGTRTLVFAEVAGSAEQQHWDCAAHLDVRWVHLNGAAPGTSDGLLDAVRAADLPPGRPTVWLAGEAGQVRALRRHIVRERQIDKRDVAFSGYWRRGKSEDQRVDDEAADPEL